MRAAVVWGIAYERFWASHEFDFMRTEHPINATEEEVIASTKRHYLGLAVYARQEADRVCEYLHASKGEPTP